MVCKLCVFCSHLRHDTLAQMLTLANIHAGSKVLVFETCSGLVLGAVMERMGGTSIHSNLPFARENLNFCVHLSVLYNHPLISPHQGFGSVIQMYPGGEPLRPGVDSFGFPSHFREMLHEFPICHVNALLTGTLNTKTKDPSTGTAIPPLINRHKTSYR